MAPRDPAGVWTRLQTLAGSCGPDALAALLADGELPALVLEAVEQLRERPAPARVQQVVALLLQIIELPARDGDAALAAHARDWAIDTLLDIPQAVASGGDGSDDVTRVTASPALQQLQTALCTAAAPAPVLGELQECVFSAFALQQAPLEPAAFARSLELCAAHVLDDLECALFLDAMLASRAAFAAPPALLRRLLRARSSSDASSAGRLFDQLSAAARVRVWANHLPSWEAQLQEWLLQVHATPFTPVAAIVWRESEGEEPEDAHAAFQSHSYLYTTLLEWLARHSCYLASPRSLELLSCLTRATRLRSDHRAFGRSLVHDLGFASDEPALCQRKRAFSRAPSALAALLALAQQEAAASDLHGISSASVDQRLLYEWMGLAEHPEILHEALELLLATPDERDGSKRSGAEQEAQVGAASLVGWFYAFTYADSSAASLAALVLKTASSLGRAKLPAGSTWLQQHRSEFHAQPQLCIRMAWCWLLVMCVTAADSIQNDAAVADALESLEYAFRRFAPTKPTHKRSFQVDVVAQLLSDLERRWKVAMQEDRETAQLELQERFDLPIAWLKKVVHLMQMEQQPHRVAAVLANVATSSNGPPASLSEQLAARLERLTRGAGTPSVD